MEQNNNKRKVLAGILVLGGAAIGVDQLLLGGGAPGPEAAAAADVAVIASVAAPAVASWQDSGGGLPARLAGLPGAEAAVSDALDAFRAPESWFPKPGAVESAVDAAPQQPAVRIDQFKVGAIMTGASAMATINGHTLRPGESKEGITLVEVRELDGAATVVFESQGTRLEFTPTAPQQRP